MPAVLRVHGNTYLMKGLPYLHEQAVAEVDQRLSIVALMLDSEVGVGQSQVNVSFQKVQERQVSGCLRH